MKKIIAFLILTAALTALFAPSSVSFAAETDIGVDVSAKSAYMLDYDSGTVLYSKNENERLPIASMTKIMTTLLVFEEIDGGRLQYDTEVTVSDNAASMGGSQVFLDAGAVHSVENLLKTVIVASANDSSVALAETVAGSESAFVVKMNARAKEIGMSNTNFTNCTGLPALNAYSSAKDVSIMLKKLISHQKYYEFSKIWLEDYVHPDGRTTEITNTNKLVRFYNGCDAGKTGYTSEAKFCLSASAKRGDMRIIATVVGEQNGKKRFKDVSDMFNYAFANYENKIITAQGEYIENDVEVVRGKKSSIAIAPSNNIAVFGKKGSDDGVEVVYELPQNIKAPVACGDVIGKASVVKNGVVVAEIELVAAEDVKRANFFDSIKKICSNW